MDIVKDKITIFSRSNCMQCKMVKRFLKEHSVVFKEINIDENPAAREALISAGYKTLPVVKSDKITFTGFQPAQLRKIVA